MKRFFLTMFLAISIYALVANPILAPEPRASISELYFIDQDTWQLEFYLVEYDDIFFTCDSVVMLSQSSRLKIFESYTAPPNNLYALNSSDHPDFYLNHQQDSLVLITYFDYGNATEFIHTLVYGYADCFIPVLNPGQSICCLFDPDGLPKDYFYKDDTPTIGEPNDYEGATAYLQGKMYDITGQLITSLPENNAFCLSQNMNWHYVFYYGIHYYDILGFSIDEEGNYSTGILAHQSEIAKLYLLTDVWSVGSAYFRTAFCNTIIFNLEPGSILDVDIHLADSTFLVGISEPIKRILPNISVAIAPNPFSDFTQLFLESDEGLSDVAMHIYNASGSIVKSYLLPQGEKTMLIVRKTDLGAPGIYSYAVQRENNVLRSGKLVCY
jgi:hypothetical protein